MSKLADVTFEGGSLPTGVTSAVSGTGAVTYPTPGLVGGSSNKLRLTMPTSSTAYVKLDFTTMSGVGQAVVRGVGGYVKVTAKNAGNANVTRLVRLSGGSSDNSYLCAIIWQSSAWVIQYATGATTATASLPATVDPGDGNPHSFYLACGCNSTANRGWVGLWWDGDLVAWTAIDQSTLSTSFGSGVSTVRLGDHVGGASQSLTAEFDGVYVGDSIFQEISSEGGFTGYSGTPVSASNASVTLSTGAGSPSWSCDDTSVMTVSGGVVTLQQAAGGVAVIKDGTGSCRRIEFAPRTVSWGLGARNVSGSTFTAPITLSSVSDGVTSYADLWPAVIGVNCRLTGITGTVPSLTGTFTTAGFAGTPQAYVNGSLLNFTSATARRTLGPRSGSRGVVTYG